MIKATPLQEVKTRFENKETLVKELTNSYEKPEGLSKDEWKQKLLKVPNSKLLKLHSTMTTVKEKFGSKEALVDAICSGKFQGRKVDQDYRTKLMGLSLGRLVDTHRSVSKKKAA